ncbi:GH3 auxin-responsive promoter family protein [bacterium]|nr:GH3 auxin-responsive promoter family protein [bacterium]
MSIKTIGAKLFASYIVNKTKKWSSKPVETQNKVFHHLIQNLANTQFGKDHGITGKETISEFQAKIPVRDYEANRKYFDKIAAGEENVNWPGKPLYLAKTSGTTSGTKYIPISPDSISNHINSARNALLHYVHETGKAEFLNGRVIFLSGSPTLEKKSGILTGRLSGISNHHVPGYLRKNQLPSFETNCIEDWETKIEKIADETINEDMTLISGIPPWVQMYFDILQERTGKKISEIFPNFNLFVYGGVNFEPYREKLERSVGKKVDSIELFPASEGFFAYQNEQDDSGLLLLLDTGIFYEFIPQEEIHLENPKRLTIEEVELDQNYALIVSSNAGLWAYDIGDMVKFTSLNPYKVRVAGRVKHYISAFGEHVIGEEVEYAILETAKEQNIAIIEFTVAPQVNPTEGLPHHEWLVEFGDLPQDMEAFALEVDHKLRKKNSYYDDLIRGSILRTLKITPLEKDSFISYMKSQGKLGGQNKVPRLSNDRKIADALIGLQK